MGQKHIPRWPASSRSYHPSSSSRLQGADGRRSRRQHDDLSAKPLSGADIELLRPILAHCHREGIVTSACVVPPPDKFDVNACAGSASKYVSTAQRRPIMRKFFQGPTAPPGKTTDAVCGRPPFAQAGAADDETRCLSSSSACGCCLHCMDIAHVARSMEQSCASFAGGARRVRCRGHSQRPRPCPSSAGPTTPLMRTCEPSGPES